MDDAVMERMMAALKSGSGGTFDLAANRRRIEGMGELFSVIPQVECAPVTIDYLPAEMISPPGCTSPVWIIYLHGGSYLYGSINTHRSFCSRLSVACGCRVLLLGYRLAPEHPYPAALEDAQTAFHWLVGKGVSPTNIVMAGESAGGGLALAATMALRDDKSPLPVRLVCLSPWLNLTPSEAEWKGRAEALGDETASPRGLVREARLYAADAALNEPHISPIYGNPGSLPPMLIQVAASEVMQPDAKVFSRRAMAQGTDVHYTEWDGVFHGWQLFAQYFSKAQQALDEVVVFICSAPCL